ncbi:substrate-binding domain-containing protein [Cellulosimicrobium sp. CUA-896]|uniref:substrate-binding domain-containing protein n=1 Tax=Cellulosimicrobium sp. CUA-896 TaxID=1517881 RepID=UPI0021014082|nr:substrate-binding domain-containing protein [Cellulosimicrobium sp. CUA-896]
MEAEDLRGLVLAPRTDTPHAQELVQWLARTDVPHVLVEREAALSPHREALESVVSDHALGALMAVHHLADLGHRRVGLVLSRQSPTSRKIAAGWRAACNDLGLSSEEHFERLAPDRHRPEFAKAIAEVVDTALESGTTALLAHSDPEAFAIVQNAQDRGLSVPGDLSVVAYDDEVAGLFSPALTAVRPPRSASGTPPSTCSPSGSRTRRGPCTGSRSAPAWSCASRRAARAARVSCHPPVNIVIASGAPTSSHAAPRARSASPHAGESTAVDACRSPIAVCTALSPLEGRRSSTRVASRYQPSRSCASMRPSARPTSAFSRIVSTSPKAVQRAASSGVSASAGVAEGC